MGFVLSVIYFFTNYLTPASLFGAFANLRIELILAILIVLLSLPPLMKSFLLKIPQSLAMIGLAVAIFVSVLMGSRGLDDATQLLLVFLSSGVTFYFVCLHCNTTRRLKVMVGMMFLVCLVVIGRGTIDMSRGVLQKDPPTEIGFGTPVASSVTASPYFQREGDGKGGWIYRLQGLGEINDPNDFGQLTVCVIPLIFIFWRKKKWLSNVLCVILPICVLLFGEYLTHSRGTLLALTVVAIMAARPRIGTLPAALLAAGMFMAAMALHFTGGRAISATAGEDRTALWGESLEILKVHPIFGVGFRGFEVNAGLTAHNSVAICVSELGLFGLYFWSLFLFPTFRDALVISSPRKVNEGEPIIEEETMFPQATRTFEEIDKKEINRLGQLMFLSLIGFLVSGWFLSRAFVMTLFLLGGMTEAVYQMALRRGMVGPRLRHERVLPYSGVLAASLILLLYVAVRVLNLSR